MGKHCERTLPSFTTDLAHLAIIPDALIASLVLSFTWLGDEVRKAFDVKHWYL